MKKKRKGKKLMKVINDMMEMMMSHENLSPKIGRKSKTETSIQETVFSKLDMNLPDVVQKYYGYTRKTAKKIVDKDFCFEAKTNCHVSSVQFFGKPHRPDAEFELKGVTYGFEIKKGKKGFSIRSGIGQSIVYSTQFDFVLYFFVDTSKGRDIKNVEEGSKESAIIDSLWDDYNIKFVII